MRKQILTGLALAAGLALSGGAMAQCDAVFRAIDVDQSGQLSESEIERFVLEGRGQRPSLQFQARCVNQARKLDSYGAVVPATPQRRRQG